MPPKAADRPGAAQLVDRYEQLRQAAADGSGGWRHGLGVLATKGMAAWIAAWAALPAPAEPGDTTAATPRADSSLSTTTPSLPAPGEKGGPEPARESLPPAATATVVAVLAQMTLACTRPTPQPP
jgi:hypothetical protein